MALKISSSGLFHRHYLVLKRDGIKYFENGMIFGARRFRFHDISCVLMSPDNVLSFQAGNEVFSILTKPEKARHQEAIAALLAGLGKSKPSQLSAIRYSI
jgi:hypothetical protein